VYAVRGACLQIKSQSQPSKPCRVSRCAPIQTKHEWCFELPKNFLALSGGWLSCRRSSEAVAVRAVYVLLWHPFLRMYIALGLSLSRPCKRKNNTITTPRATHIPYQRQWHVYACDETTGVQKASRSSYPSQPTPMWKALEDEQANKMPDRPGGLQVDVGGGYNRSPKPSGWAKVVQHWMLTGDEGLALWEGGWLLLGERELASNCL